MQRSAWGGLRRAIAKSWGLQWLCPLHPGVIALSMLLQLRKTLRAIYQPYSSAIVHVMHITDRIISYQPAPTAQVSGYIKKGQERQHRHLSETLGLSRNGPFTDFRSPAALCLSSSPSSPPSPSPPCSSPPHPLPKPPH